MYSWADIAERTERVYARAMATPHKDVYERMSRCVVALRHVRFRPADRPGRRRYMDLGSCFGPIMCIITAVQGLFLLVLHWLQPEDEVDIVPRSKERNPVIGQ